METPSGQMTTQGTPSRDLEQHRTGLIRMGGMFCCPRRPCESWVLGPQSYLTPQNISIPVLEERSLFLNQGPERCGGTMSSVYLKSIKLQHPSLPLIFIFIMGPAGDNSI